MMAFFEYSLMSLSLPAQMTLDDVFLSRLADRPLDDERSPDVDSSGADSQWQPRENARRPRCSLLSRGMASLLGAGVDARFDDSRLGTGVRMTLRTASSRSILGDTEP